MDNVIVKYSEFFEDDGGFEKVKRDFVELGKDLIKEAEKIKSQINVFDLGQVEQINEIEQATEKLADQFKDYGEARKEINKLEQDFIKTQRASDKATKNQVKTLENLQKELDGLRTDLKEVNALERAGVKTTEEASKERANLRLEIRRVNGEINKNQKEVIESNKLSRQEEKLLKAQIVLQKDRVETLADVRERLSALRLVASQVNITTEEGQEQLKAFNDEINSLTDTLEENSDKFIQNKINVGNYEESIVNALGSTGLLSTGIGGLDQSLSSLVGILTLSKQELADIEENLDNNTSAVKRFAVGFGRLNRVLKASIIGAVLVAVAALGSAFGNTRAGAVRLEKVFSTLQSVFASTGKAALTLASGIGNAFSILFDSVSEFFEANQGKSFGELVSDFFTGDLGILDVFANNFRGQVENIRNTFNDVADVVENGADAVILGLDNINRAFELEDTVRRLNRELEILQGNLAIADIAAGDTTISLREQLEATRRSLELTEEIADKNIEIAEAQLEAVNERVKANVLANNEEAKNLDLQAQGLDFALATQRLAEERGVELEISNDLIEEQQQAIIDLTAAENELASQRRENTKLQREIQRDLFEQNLDLLIDFIDTEKNLNEQLVNDTSLVFRDRLVEFNNFVQQFRQNAQRELDEFTNLAATLGRDLDFQIEFDEDGSFQVFVNDSALAVDNIVELNKQVQDLGLPEQAINRFREFIVEARNGQRDFININRELEKTGILVRQLAEDLQVDQEEFRQLEEVSRRIAEIAQIDQTGLTPAEQQRILQELEDLEKRKTEIQRDAENERIQNRIDAIDAEIATVKAGSDREIELQRERIALQKQLQDSADSIRLDTAKQTIDKLAKQQEELETEVKRILGNILDAVVENQNEQVSEQQKRIDRQDEAVDTQRRRAEQGLENTLAFEQRARAQEEAELQRRQKRLERAEKIRALFTSFTANSNNPQLQPGEALARTIRDFAILEAIAATFGEGGAAEDVIGKVPTDGKGITRGRSHSGRRGGIPVLIEGKEGFFSSREMANLGKDNFYRIKQMAGLGPIDRNFFTGQKNDFVAAFPKIIRQDDTLVHEMREVKKAIKSKPDQFLNVPEVVNGILQFTETIKDKNVTKRNHYRIRKPRI